MDNPKLLMDEMKEDVKKLCQIQIICLENLPTKLEPETYKNLILEALTDAYMAGVKTGLNMAREIEKEFSYSLPCYLMIKDNEKLIILCRDRECIYLNWVTGRCDNDETITIVKGKCMNKIKSKEVKDDKKA